ncbi:MAG: RNA polymerase sigma factor [Polyangiaceae bacterium]
MHPDEPELNAAMGRYSTGDDSAFATLYRLLHPRLRSYFLRMRGRAGHADDLVQETFLRIHRARAMFGRGASALPWVYAIGRNVLIDHTRYTRLRDARTVPEEQAPEPPDTGADVESAAVASEAARAVERALSRLPEIQREAFVLVRYEGLSIKDAAAALGTTQAAVKLRAFRAYEAIRAELAAPSGPAIEDNPRGGEKPAAPSAVGGKETPVRARQK